MRCSWAAGSDEVNLGVALRLYSCMQRVALRMWSCRVTGFTSEGMLKYFRKRIKNTVGFQFQRSGTI
jgi:hypothetical protein